MNILKWIRRLLGLADEIDDIVRPIQKIARKLERLANAELGKAVDADLIATRKREEAEGRRAKAKRADELAATYGNLLGS